MSSAPTHSKTSQQSLSVFNSDNKKYNTKINNNFHPFIIFNTRLSSQ